LTLSVSDRLRLAINHVSQAQNAARMSRDEFVVAQETRQSVAYDLIVLAAHLKAIPAETRALGGSISWRNIQSTRNLLVHEPARTDWATVYEIVTRYLTELRQQLDALIAATGGASTNPGAP
jgi:uncharacterized protein with HEPN domain